MSGARQREAHALWGRQRRDPKRPDVKGRRSAQRLTLRRSRAGGPFAQQRLELSHECGRDGMLTRRRNGPQIEDLYVHRDGTGPRRAHSGHPTSSRGVKPRPSFSASRRAASRMCCMVTGP